MYNILCVDDTPANILVLESLFELYNDKYDVISAQSGQEALGILLNQSIDLILLDVMMPELNGFETAQLIKANRLTQHIPIIFLTAKRDNETLEKAFTLGVDYLSKPYDEFELFQRVDTQLKLQNAQAQLQEQIDFNRSILDSQHNIIFIQDNTKIIQANKSFLEFFQVNSVDEFNKQYGSISDLFMEYENYFAFHILNENKNWCNIISSVENEQEYNVLLMDIKTFEPKAFKIDVNIIENNLDKFVVSLTDITRLTTKSKEFETKATYDALTNIYNRSKFSEVINEHYNIFKRYNTNLSFAILDIDFFKNVNDTYGHQVGDEVLITFAKTIDDAIREADIFARWGGEEFVVLMPETTIDDAFIAVDNLRNLIDSTHFAEVEHISCSVGLSQFKTDDTVDSIVKRADDALYQAKKNGRNIVCSK